MVAGAATLSIVALEAQAPSVLNGTVSGWVSTVGSNRISVFAPSRSETFDVFVPAGFHAVDSSDGVLHGVTLAQVKPGMNARVAYRLSEARMTATHVELLTVAACRTLKSAEAVLRQRLHCPD